jgi:hypothetical protein
VWKTVRDVGGFLCKPVLAMLERRLNTYGQLTFQEVEYLLWREGASISLNCEPLAGHGSIAYDVIVLTWSL